MTITTQDLPGILENHRKWMRSEEGGVKANLRGANLSGANLRGANLGSTDLRGSYLRGADLRGADLSEKAGKLVEGRAFFQIGPVGSRDDFVLFFKTENGLFVRAGCFFDDIATFSEAVKETHAGTEHETHYEGAIAMAKKVLK